MLVRVLLCGLLLTACAGGPPGGVPRRLQTLPWSDAPADQTVLRARGLSERGDDRAALALVEEVLRAEPRHVDGHRLRQDILRQRGRRGLLLEEVAAMLRANPDDPVAHYLHGRIAFDARDKLRAFERAAALAPDLLWPWLGLAHTLRDTASARSLRLYAELYEITDAHPLVAIAFSGLLRSAGDFERQAAVCRTLAVDQRIPGVGDLGLAQALLAADDRDGAWQALLRALRLRPFDPGVQSLVQGWIRAGASVDQIGELFDTLRLDPAILSAFGQRGGELALVELLERHGQPVAALDLLERAEASARTPELRRAQRRLQLALGRPEAFLATLRADLPRELVAGESNQLRGRWLTLLDGPWCDGDPLATPAQSAALLTAMLRTGLLAEAEQMAALAIQRWPDESDAIVSQRDEARAELAFEAGMRRLLYRGYSDDDAAGLEIVLGRLRQLSRAVFGRDVVGDAPRFRVPMVGELLDPFRGDLAAHLAHYNRHLVLGQRAGGVAEGMLLSRLSVAELPEQPELPVPGRCYEVIGVDRDVRALSGVVGGDVAGIALLNHFLIDYDAVREWAGAIAGRRRIAVEDGLALVADPLPAEPGFDPVDAAWRLALVSPVEDAELDAAVLDAIRHHERQHLVDSFHYLPIEFNLGRGFGLIWQFGWSPTLIHAEMERRAELASLALSPHTELVLAHIVDFSGDPGIESPHHRGFRQLGRDLQRRLEALGVPPGLARPSRWHELDMVLVRRAARELLSTLR